MRRDSKGGREVKMKKILCVVLLVVCVAVMLTACGNRAWVSDSFQNEVNYVVMQEADGVWRIHKIKKWADDSQSESFCVLTECCGNYIWGSANNAFLYKNPPYYLEGIQQCG